MPPARHRLPRSPGAALGLALLGLLLAGCGGTSPDVRPRRVVLITLDTLRYDALFGAAAAMPQLARRAAAGLVFDHFYSATSCTQPTHASIFTGLQPWEHGLTRNGLVLRSELETLAERLSAAGWSTHAVVASVPLDHRFLFNQGFEQYDDVMTEEHERHKDEWNELQLDNGKFYSLAEHVTGSALAQLDAAEGSRQFFWFHYFDPHPPYGDAAGGEQVFLGDIPAAITQGPEATAALLTRARALYDADVASLDAQLERVLARLEQDDDRYETHVIVTADHGESFGEDHSFGHRRRVTPYQVHVPCVILGPGVPSGHRDEPAGSVDLFGTVLALARVSPGQWSGRDLLVPPGDHPTSAAGMRASVTQPVADPRTNGHSVLIEGNQFFLVDEDGYFIGDTVRIQGGGEDVTSELIGRVAATFKGFEAALEQSSSEELEDEATRDALKELGY